MAITHTAIIGTSFDPSGADGSWWEKDMFTDHGIPKSSIAVFRLFNGDVASQRRIGVRAMGSALVRYWSMREPEDGGRTGIMVNVQLDSDGKCEVYSAKKADTTHRCVGYFEGVAYTEAMDNFQAVGSGAWENKDLFTDYGYPKDRVYEIVYGNDANAATNSMGVRTDGSGVARRQTLEEAEGDGLEPASTFVLSDASTGIIEVYAGDHTEAEFYVAGYFDNTVTFTERQDNLGAVADSTWENEDLSGFGCPANAIVSCLCCNDEAATENRLGIRANGSADDRWSDIHEGEGGGLTTARYCVTVDASSIIEIYEEDASTNVIYHQGWFSDVAPAVGQPYISRVQYVHGMRSWGGPVK